MTQQLPTGLQHLETVAPNDIGMSREEFAKMEKYTEDALNIQMDASAIPDLDEKLVHINNMLEEIETEAMQKLEKTNKKEFEMILTHKYYNDIQSLKIINLMLEPQRYENLDKLLDMFERLKKVKSGHANINTAHKDWCNKMNNEYVYPQFGGKDGFEKKMAELAKAKST